MARIIVFGGHGKVARLTSPPLVAAGHAVTGIIRDPAQVDAVASTGADPVVADIEGLGIDALADLIRGHDAVLWSAGAGGGNPARTRAVDHDAAIASMDAAVAAGVDRYVMVSYLGSRRDHGIDPSSSFHPYAEAKALADEHLRATPLAWTILGPGALTEEPGTGRIEISATPASRSVPRADVAAVAAAVLDRPASAGHTIGFNSGPTPIPEALDALVVAD